MISNMQKSGQIILRDQEGRNVLCRFPHLDLLSTVPNNLWNLFVMYFINEQFHSLDTYRNLPWKMYDIQP